MLLQNFIKLSASVHELYRVHKLFALSPSGKKKSENPVLWSTTLKFSVFWAVVKEHVHANFIELCACAAVHELSW